MMNGNGKKIAILLPRFSGGGAERVSLVLARSLRVYGYTTELWATRFDAERREAIEKEGIATASPRDIAGKVKHRSRRATETVAAMVKARGIEILVLSVSPLGYMGDLKRMIGDRCRLVFHLHGQPYWELIPFAIPKPELRSVADATARCLSFLKKDFKEVLFKTYTRRANKLYKETFAAADAYVVLCESYKRELAARLGLGADNSRIHAIYNPIANFDRLSALARQPKRREVVFVGRLTRDDKRVDRLLHIWARVGIKHGGWMLCIVGDGPEKANLEKLARELKLPNVAFEGYANPEKYYADAAVVALTSTFEGWPGSLLEGLAAGCRPIAFGCSAGVEEILEDGRGVCIPPFDIDRYADSLSALMSAEPRKELPQVCRWLSNFTDAAVADRWNTLFASLTASGE